MREERRGQGVTRRGFLGSLAATCSASVFPLDSILADEVGRKVFKDDWDYLKRKWREPCANPTTGLERDDFRMALKRLIEEREPLDSWSVVKAKVFSLGCDRAAVGASSHDWYPAFASWHYHRNHPFGPSRRKRAGEVDAKYAPELPAQIRAATKSGLFTVWKDFCHCSPDWDRILALGFTGMKAELLKHWKDTEYYKSKLLAIDAVLRLLDRLIAEVARVDKVERDEKWGRLAKELASLRRLRSGKPETAYDVLMFIYLFWVMCENFDDYQARTLGNIDRLLTPYYRADIAAGRTTEAEFRNQLVHFWWQWGSIDNYWGQPVYVGGTQPDGSTEYNEVSKIVLDVHDELALPTPKLHLKMAKNTPDWVWRRTLDMTRRQRSVSFCGEEPIARVMKSRGYTAEEARTCIIWGCYEWGVRDSANGNGAGHQNLLKNVELLLADAKDGKLGELGTFADFKAAFYRQLGASLEKHVELVRINDLHLADVNPSNLFALSVGYSVEKGLEPLAGGTARGNGTGMMMIGIGTTVDALAAVKEIVYDRREMSLAELGRVMAANWAGHEELRLRMLRSKRKWGNNDPEVNALGVELVKFCSGKVLGQRNARGGRFTISGHTARQHIELGKSTGATPDGRLAGEEMSKNLSPTMGADTEGVTALIDTLANLDARDLPGDFPLDVALLPGTVAGEKGLAMMRTIVEQYFANGGMVIQFNVHDPKTLRDAQKHPEKYENLQVRVCGWNVRWNDIPKVEQDKFILRAETIAR